MEVRPITADEARDFSTAIQHGFYQTPSPARLERASHTIGIAGLEHTRAVFDDEKIVATSGSYPWDMVVPGGNRVPCAGITWVTVHTTHRRRGLMTRMLDEHHAQAREEARPLAALWASESIIYGRFGYGIATEYIPMEVDPRRVRFRSDTPEPDPIRMVDRDEALEIFPAIAEQVTSSRPGGFIAPQAWWEHRTLSVPEEGESGPRMMVSERDGRPTGYAIFEIEAAKIFDGGASIDVHQAVGLDPAASAGLWRHLLSHDLVTKVSYFLMPIDDPLRSFLTEPRLVETKLHDGMWVRLLDVGEALSQRSYSTPIDVVLEVTDPDEDMAPRWRLQSDGDRTTCTEADDPPQLSLGLEALGSIYMGRPCMFTLADAGRVVGDRDVIERTAQAFAWTPTPYCPQIF